MVMAAAILVAVAHDGSIDLTLCLVYFPVQKNIPFLPLHKDLHHCPGKMIK